MANPSLKHLNIFFLTESELEPESKNIHSQILTSYFPTVCMLYHIKHFDITIITQAVTEQRKPVSDQTKHA